MDNSLKELLVILSFITNEAYEKESTDGSKVIIFSSEYCYASVLKEGYKLGQILSNLNEEESILTDKWAQNPLIVFPEDVTLFNPAKHPVRIDINQMGLLDELYDDDGSIQLGGLPFLHKITL